MYQALYRKWRPRTFSEVVGQAHITDTLQRQVAEGRVGHAYLFTGTRGTGKTTCARILAKAVNCEHPVDGAPCCECDACRGIDSGTLLDVTELDAASNNGVDQVRALREEAVYTPSVLKKRVYIIDEVHMLSIAAFNALLKILEEPPDYGVFLILSTNAERLLPTIRSRCAELQLGPVAQDEALPFLRQNAPDKPDGVLRAAYLRAGGFLGQALTLLQDAEDEPFVRQFAAAYAAHDRMALLRVLLPMEKAKREQLLPALQQLRACICGALTQRGGLDTASESAAQIVASRSGSELLQASDSIQAAIDALAANASAGAVTGYLAMKLR